MDEKIQNIEIYHRLVDSIGTAIENARQRAFQAVNNELLKANWEIGKFIVEYEQHGNEKAEYGSSLLTNLSKDLKSRFGKGFSKSNIYLMRQFYLKYQIFQSVTGKLTWTHYAELLAVSDDHARGFYEKQAVNENWSVRELKRQISSSLFERLALSQDKSWILRLSEKGLIVTESKRIDNRMKPSWQHTVIKHSGFSGIVVGFCSHLVRVLFVSELIGNFDSN